MAPAVALAVAANTLVTSTVAAMVIAPAPFVTVTLVPAVNVALVSVLPVVLPIKS